MTLRLADIGARIEGIHQLGSVVGAMRGIAAARAQQARDGLAAVDGYAAIIAGGIGQALAAMPTVTAAPPASRYPALVVFAAEQGFAGAFSDHVFDGALPDLATHILFVVGTRGASVLRERGIVPAWTIASPAHPGGMPKLADSISQALYAQIATGAVDGVDVVHMRSTPGSPPNVVRDTVLPLALRHDAASERIEPPLLNLSPPILLAGLTAEYLHAQLCRAALHGFAAENEARTMAMAAARDHMDRSLATLRRQERQVRQEEITAEVIELAAGAAAGRR